MSLSIPHPRKPTAARPPVREWHRGGKGLGQTGRAGVAIKIATDRNEASVSTAAKFLSNRDCRTDPGNTCRQQSIRALAYFHCHTFPIANDMFSIATETFRIAIATRVTAMEPPMEGYVISIKMCDSGTPT